MRRPRKRQPRIGPRKATTSTLPPAVKAALEKHSRIRGVTQAQIVTEALAAMLGVAT